MCGLAGILSLTGEPILDPECRVRRMIDLLKHRGPDSQGVMVSDDGVVAMGNARLAITDPSAPVDVLWTQDHNAAISFNGEIYDYRELRSELEARGVRFRHRTDTEVLLEGLRLDGDGLLRRLDGMWAFAYYDVRTRKLLLSRDVMGERHLFYRVVDGELIFASEPLPILVDRGRPEEIDFEALVTALRYDSAPPGRTLVKGLRRLLPGHNLEATVANGWREYRYRRLHPERWLDFFRSNPSLDSIVDVFEEIMLRVTQRRLPPDVQFISTLSGGLDSALICAYASEMGNKEIRTLFGQSAEAPARNLPDELDEYEASKVTSARFRTRHRQISINNDDCIPVLRRFAANGFDGMFNSGTASFEMLAWQVRRDNTKVMLISDGPDELVGGYNVDRRAWEFDMYRARHPARYRMTQALSGWSSTRVGRRVLRVLGRKYTALPPDSSAPVFRFVPIHQCWSLAVLAGIVGAEHAQVADQYYGVFDHEYDDVFSELDYSQVRALSYAATSLPDMFNLRTDKAFLRASVECRLPFQAPEFVEFQIALPGAMRFGNGHTTKYLMRKIVERRVGPEVANRSKHGFSAPLFNTPAVREALNFDETIAASPCFEELPFARGAREAVLRSSGTKVKWPFYVIAKTYDQLRRGIYTGHGD